MPLWLKGLGTIVLSVSEIAELLEGHAGGTTEGGTNVGDTSGCF